MHTCVWCVRVRVWCHAPRDPATAHVTELGRKPAAGIWRAVSSSQPARTTLTTQYHLCRHVIISPSDGTASSAVCLVTGVLPSCWSTASPSPRTRPRPAPPPAPGPPRPRPCRPGSPCAQTPSPCQAPAPALAPDAGPGGIHWRFTVSKWPNLICLIQVYSLHIWNIACYLHLYSYKEWF